MEHHSDLGTQARQMAEQQKEAGADHLHGVADAIHGAARELEEKLPGAAGYIHDAAARLDDGAASLRNRNIDDLMSSFGQYARRQPALVLAGAAIAGLALSRFLKASGKSRES